MKKPNRVVNICIVGTGYVGLVSGTCFAEMGHKVVCVDNNEEKIRVLNEGQVPIYEPGLKEVIDRNTAAGRLKFSTSIKEGVKESEAVFIAVNTPPKPDGEADLSYVENVSREIAENLDGYRLIVEKSTVPVETADRVVRTIKLYAPKDAEFDVASNPEFLREGSAVGDFLNPDRVVVGVNSGRAKKIFEEIYSPLEAPLIVTDIRSAEIIKHASNSFLATKISFINAIACICELTGADVEKVAEGMGFDQRIGRAFLNAGAGYGGSCFPKDVAAFIRIAGRAGFDFDLLKAVEGINQHMRRQIVKKTLDALWILKGKTIAVLGLAFKPETDDMRNAPSIDIIKELIKEEAVVRAYDPEAMERAKEVMPAELIYCTSAEEAVKGADGVILITEWDEFKKIKPETLKKWLRHPILIDGRNTFDPDVMEKAGFQYYSVGRRTVGL